MLRRAIIEKTAQFVHVQPSQSARVIDVIKFKQAVPTPAAVPRLSVQY